MKIFLIGILATAAIVASCEKGNKDVPTVSFATAIPVTSDGEAALVLQVENYTGTDAVTIPLTFGGDAVLDTDYTVSAEAFVYGGTDPVTTITLTPVNYGTEKSVTVTLTPPDGFGAGRYVSTTFTLSDKVAYISFANDEAIMTSSVRIPFNLYDATGNPFRLQNGDRIPVVVDTEASTAVEGSEFRFKDGHFAAIGAGEFTGYLELEIAGLIPPDRSTLVLKLDPGSKYGIGQFDKVTVSILGSNWDYLDGTWKLLEFVTSKESMLEDWWLYDTPEQLNGWPEPNENDGFTINTGEGIFTPSFQSEFKNYFIGESTITPGEEFELRVSMQEKIQMQLFWLDNTNRNFSATSTSDDKESVIGMTIQHDENGNPSALMMYIIDYHPTDFLSIFDDYYMYNDEKPVLTMTGSFMQALFIKAE